MQSMLGDQGSLRKIDARDPAILVVQRAQFHGGSAAVGTEIHAHDFDRTCFVFVLGLGVFVLLRLGRCVFVGGGFGFGLVLVLGGVLIAHAFEHVVANAG